MLAVMLLAGCSVSKFIPEGSYLLDDVKIESDNKEIKFVADESLCPSDL